MNQIINPGDFQRKLSEGHYSKLPTELSHAEIHGLRIALNVYKNDRVKAIKVSQYAQ